MRTRAVCASRFPVQLNTAECVSSRVLVGVRIPHLRLRGLLRVELFAVGRLLEAHPAELLLAGGDQVRLLLVAVLPGGRLLHLVHRLLAMCFFRSSAATCRCIAADGVGGPRLKLLEMHVTWTSGVWTQASGVQSTA